MTRSGSVIAIITARGGSKGVPGKNVRLLNGKPLIAYSILAALECAGIARCLVSTDDAEIAEISVRWGAEVIERPAALATDTSSSQDAVRHVLHSLEAESALPEYFVLLQPTSPLRNALHLQQCLDRFFASGCACAISVAEAEHHPYKCFVSENGTLTPAQGIAFLDKPRQSLPPAYRQNGAIYLLKTEEFLRHDSFFIPPAMPFVMEREESIDIDTEDDLLEAGRILSRKSPGSVYLTVEDSPLPRIPRRAGKPFRPGALKRDFIWRTAMAAQQREAAQESLPHCEEIGTCPMCSDAAHTLFVTVYGFPYLECAACGHIYSSRVPASGRLEELYSGDDPFSSLQQSVYLDEEIHEERVHTIAAPKVAFVREVVPPGGVWVDVGCGAGEMLSAARDAGFTVVGIEPDRVEAEFARRRGFEVVSDFAHRGNIGELCAGADVVSLVNVLEHIKDPKGLVAALSVSLKAGATLVVEVPRHPSISSLASLAFPELSCRHIYPPDHLHVFTEKSLHHLLQGAPLRVAGLWNFGQDVHDLLQSVAVGSGIAATPFVTGVLEAAGKLQLCCDSSGLSDTVFLVCERV